MKPHNWTNKQYQFLEQNVKGIGDKELTEIFNKEFNLDLTLHQIKSAKKRKKLKSGLDTRFKKGQASWNKGLKGVVTGGKETQFKKGQKPHNYMKVGTERVNGDGYVDVKIADPNKWKGKHIVIWEEHNGPVPKDHAIIFGDRDNRNFDINNLLCVSRKQLLQLNRNHLIKDNRELTKIGIVIADINSKVAERKK